MDRYLLAQGQRRVLGIQDKSSVYRGEVPPQQGAAAVTPAAEEPAPAQQFVGTLTATELNELKPWLLAVTLGSTGNTDLAGGYLAADVVKIHDSDDSHELSLVWNEAEASANRTLNLLVRGGNRTIDLYENLKILDGQNIELHASGGEKAQLAIDTQNAERTLDMSANLTIGSGSAVTLTAKDAAATILMDNANFEVENTNGTQRSFKITSAKAGNTTVTLQENLTINDGYDVTLQALGQANSLVLNESLTLGGGYDGTLTFSTASKVLTVDESASMSDFVRESDYNADTFLYATNNNTPVATSPANVMAALSGHAAASFSFNAQYVTNVQQLRGCPDHNLNIYPNAATTDATERDMIFWTLDATGDAWVEVFRCEANSTTPVLKMAKSLNMNSQNITGVATIASGAGTLTIDETASLSDYHTDTRGDARYYTKTEFDTWASNVVQQEMDYLDGVTSDIQDQLDARCLESVFGTAIGTGLVLDTATLKASAILQKYHGIDPAANVQSFLGAVDYAAMMALLSGTATAAFNLNGQALTSVGAIGCATITTTGNLVMPDGGTIGQAAGPLLTFDNTNDYLEITGCKVGIGIPTPSHALDVYGNFRAYQSIANTACIVECTYVTGDAQLTFKTRADRTCELRFEDDVGLAGRIYYAHASDAMAFVTAAVARMTINSVGSVNIVAHDAATAGLKLGGTLVTASATELNINDGLTATTAEINQLDGNLFANAAVADDARGISSICTLVTNAKSDGIAAYFEGHIDGITDGPTYGAGAWLNIDSGSTLGADARAFDIGIYESGADCSGGNAYGLAIHMEFDDTNPPAGIYPFRINCNDTANHATPDALIFAPNKSAIALTDAAPGTSDAYLKIKLQSGEVYRIMLVKE